MFQPIPRPPPAQEAGSFRIAWWQAGPGDESTRQRTGCATLAEAQAVLDLLAADPAASSFRCNWLEPDGFDAIPF